MKVKRKICLVLTLSCLTNMVMSASLDSLKTLLKTELSVEDHVKVLSDIAYEYIEIDTKKAITIAREALELSKKHKYYVGLKKSYGQLGSAYMKMGDNTKAIENYILAEKYAQKSNDKVGQSVVNHNLAILYRNNGRLKDAKKYIQKAVLLDLSLDSPFDLATSYNTYGAILLELNEIDSSAFYLNKSVETFKSIDKIYYAAPALSNLAKIERERKNYDKAINYYKQSISYYRDAGYDKRAANSMRMVAEIYFTQNKIELAIKTYEESLLIYDIYEDEEFNSRIFFSGMAEAYIEKGNFEKAYKSIKKAYDLMDVYFNDLDSLNDLSRDSLFTEMATKYETEKKEKELEIKNLKLEKSEKENKSQRNIILLGSLGLFLLFGLLVLSVYSYRRSKSTNRKIHQQKDEIEKQRDEISVKNNEITSSIQYAKTLQDAILPDEKYILKNLPEHFILWLPRDIVSGDFYWYYEVKGKVYFAVADCTGHGVPGAFVSMTCHNVLNQVVIDQGLEKPGEILSKVHRIVSSVFHREGSLSQANDGMDIVLCCIENNSDQLTFAGAMNPLIHISNDDLTECRTDRMAIGGRTPMDYEFETHSLNYKPGDWFYMYSDGFQDQFGGKHGKKFMSGNFKKLLLEISIKNPEEQKKILTTRLKDWQGDFDRIDDILVAGFKV